MVKPSILLLGAGNMGGALFSAWLQNDAVDSSRSAVIDPNPSERIETLCAERGVALNPPRDDGYDACVLAVKPQQFPSVLPSLDWPGIERTLFVSVAAGVTIETIEQLMAERTPSAKVVRTMPSLPASIGQGVTLLCAGEGLTEADRGVADALMAAAGETYWCDGEDQLDQLMGVTGCSPAYVFLLAEALRDAAEARGASPDDARRMAEASVTGAAAMLASDGRDASTLRAAVTSPGGTTQAALDVLDGESGLRGLVDRAVTNAYDRARQLAGD